MANSPIYVSPTDLRNLIQLHPDPMLIVNASGLVQFTNAAAEDVLGGEPAGKPLPFSLDQPTIMLKVGFAEQAYRTLVITTTWGGNFARLVVLQATEGETPSVQRVDVEQAFIEARGEAERLKQTQAEVERLNQELAQVRQELTDAGRGEVPLAEISLAAPSPRDKTSRRDPLQETQAALKTKAELERLAFEDRLTGLANLNILEPYLKMVCGRAQMGYGTVALLVLDLDRFHALNQTLGQERGDLLLRLVGERLRAVVGDRGVVARRGEDEFMSVLFHPSDSTEPMDMHSSARLLATQLLHCLDSPFTIEEGESANLQGSIGISFCPNLASSVQQMFEQADAALHLAKRTGRNRYKFYGQDFHQERVKRRQNEVRIREGWARGEFQVHYQPIVDLDDGRLAGMEALLRWQHPGRGLLEPGDFLEVALDAGLLVPIGEWVLAQACEAARQLHKKQFVSVNLEVRHMIYAGFVERFFQIVQKAGIRADRLVVELSEGNNALEEVSEALARLQKWGVRVAVDDVGTGASSIKRLHQVQPAFLKIDHIFVEGLPNDRGRCAICLAIMGLAASAESLTVAEGIETEAQCVYIRQYGGDLGQGRYFCEPVGADQLKSLSRHRWELKGKRLKR